MKSFVAWLQAFTLAIGGPGLFIIAFLDSSFLSLPQVNDLLVVTMVAQHPHRFAYYAAMATLGSLAGCLALYVVGRRGGKALLHTRFGSGRMQRVSQIFQRRGLVAEIIKLSGSVELGPLTGLADRIVDLVSTGETLRQNGLVEVDTILRVTSRLVVNRASLKLRGADVDALVRRLRAVVRRQPRG